MNGDFLAENTVFSPYPRGYPNECQYPFLHQNASHEGEYEFLHRRPVIDFILKMIKKMGKLLVLARPHQPGHLRGQRVDKRLITYIPDGHICHFSGTQEIGTGPFPLAVSDSKVTTIRQELRPHVTFNMPQ